MYLNHKFESKEVINLFSKLPYSVPYAVCQNYITSAISQYEEKMLVDSFVHFSSDNADFNSVTLDGLNTLHAMGGIQCITPRRCILPQNAVKKPKIKVK